MDSFWYVAYGSNTSLRHFRSRFEGAGDEPVWERETWVWLPHELYFASSSQTWGGTAVAFIALERSQTRPTLSRAFLIERERFNDVLAAEHLRIPLAWDFDVRDLDIGSWCPLPTKAKYNAVVRVPNISDTPAFAITTARRFEPGRPSDAYLATCREGLVSAQLLDEVDEYLASAVERSQERAIDSVVPRAGAPFAWRTVLKPLGSTGYPTIRLGPDEAWLAVDGPVLGTVESSGRCTDVWLLPPRDGTHAGASPQVYRALGLGRPFPGELPARLTAEYPIPFQRCPATSEDVEIADRAQVTPAAARELGSWALLMSPTLSGPVSVSPRQHVPHGSVRVSYAGRELWEFGPDSDSVHLVPLGAPGRRRTRRKRSARRGLVKALEAFLGAPAVPLRSTESVVGDEGRAVVRVDATALDFLGVRPGEEVIVSWAGRETTARALLHTGELRERMREQLAQATGRQSRLSTRAGTGDERILWHLQAWLSPSVRDALVIPPDTVVRIRRDILHAIRRHLLALQIPVGGLTIAVLAIPGVPLFLKVTVPVVALLMAFMPIRLRRT